MKEKINDAGILYRMKLERNSVLAVYSKQGTFRGGKKRSVSKTVTILLGKILIISEKEGKDILSEKHAGDTFEIDAGVPNLFYFSEDTEFIEWWEKDVTEEKYNRYYECQQMERFTNTIKVK